MARKSESEWILKIDELLRQENLRPTLETPTSIFKLSDSIINKNPESYSPSHLFLGPYHHPFKSPDQLPKIEIFKLENAKEAKEKFHLPEFNQMVNELKESDVQNQIRASYSSDSDHNLDDMGSELLAWIMLIDGLFLLRLLGVFHEDSGNNQNRNRNRIRSFEYYLPVFKDQEFYLKNLDQETLIKTQNEVVKDILKLKNQIPFKILKRVLPRNLNLLFYKFCLSISPFSLPSYYNNEIVDFSEFPKLSDVVDQSQHLLHFLYNLIFYQRLLSLLVRGKPAEERSASDQVSVFKEVLNAAANVLKLGIFQQLFQVFGLIQSLIVLLVKVQSSFKADDTTNSPTFPSASELRKVGLRFEFGEKSILDKEKKILRLPRIIISDFSQVILRNLVAFEVEAKLNPPWLTHYVTMMSGLIVTAKDVGILKQAKIVVRSNLDDDDELEDIVKLFKELRDQLSEKSTPEFPFAIYEIHMMKEMKEYYESRWRIKAERFAKRRICPLFQILLILVVLLLIAFVVIKTVCGWFSCPKIFGHNISVVEEILNAGNYLL